MTVVRKIAAMTPAVWKAGAAFDAGKISAGSGGQSLRKQRHQPTRQLCHDVDGEHREDKEH